MKRYNIDKVWGHTNPRPKPEEADDGEWVLADDAFTLLKKYIQHVGECEGISFLRQQDRSQYSDRLVFTDEEWKLLQELQAEIGG